jgi:hypothetical protein
MVVYLVILFYKCLCSKNYEQWRRTWSTVNIKRQYDLIHSKKKHRKCKTDSSGLSSVEESLSSTNSSCSSASSSCVNTDNETSENENEASTKSKVADRNFIDRSEIRKAEGFTQSKSSNKYELINKIINGQKDNVDLNALKMLNTEPNARHAYPVDLLSCGNCVCATSDVANKIHVWSLLKTQNRSNLIKIIDLNETQSSAAVWCMCVSDDDKFLFLGQSNGVFKCIDLAEPYSSPSFDYNSNQSGITNLIQIKSKLSIPFQFGYLVLLTCLDGCIELVSFNVKRPASRQEPAFSFVLFAQIRVHNMPITNQVFSHSSDYLLTTSQDCLLKLVKINKSIIENEMPLAASPALQQSDKIMIIIYELSTRRIMNELSLVTSMCIYDNSARNELTGASGYQNGTICVWNFLNGECEFKLRAKSAKSIIKIGIAAELLVSLSIDHQMCIWNRHRGRLIKELKFIAPLFARSSLLTSSDCDAGQTESFNFNLVTAMFFLASRLSKVLMSRRSVGKSLISPVSVSNGNSEMHIAPTMCLYSKNIVAMGGCACIFFWNIQSGELIKKVNINKEELATSISSRHSKSESFSEASYIKEIRLVKQRDPSSMKTNPNGKPCKLLIASDYNDSIYVLKIPANIF